MGGDPSARARGRRRTLIVRSRGAIYLPAVPSPRSPLPLGAPLHSLRFWLRSFGFMAALAGLLSLIFVLPAAVLGSSGRWEVWAGFALYLLFFGVGTGLRTVRHGELAERKDDRQVRSTGGKVAAVVILPGLVLAHWISLFTLSRNAAEGAGASPVALLGVGLALLGMALNIHATRTLGRFFDRLAIKEGHQLITHGIYGIIRHPIYTSYLCLFFSFPLLTRSAWGAVAVATVSGIWFGTRIPAEEAMLEEAFGEDWCAYRMRTRRLIPWLI